MFVDGIRFLLFFKQKKRQTVTEADVTAMLGFLCELIDSGRLKDEVWAELSMHATFNKLQNIDQVLLMEAHEWFVTHKTMKSLLNSDLKDAFVRPAGFVKTFSHPTRKMLKEFFIRSAAIYCVENQQVTDIIIPVYHPSRGPVSEASMSAIPIQARLHRGSISKGVKYSWLKTVPSLALHGEFSVASIFMDFGHFKDYSDKPSSLFMESFELTKTFPEPPVKVGPGQVEGPRCYGFFPKRLKLTDICKSQSDDVNKVMQQLITSFLDVSVAHDVEAEVRDQIPKMYEDLVYL